MKQKKQTILISSVMLGTIITTMHGFAAPLTADSLSKPAVNQPKADNMPEVAAPFQQTGSSIPVSGPRKQIRDELVAVRYSGEKMQTSVERVRNWNRKAIGHLNRVRPSIGRLLRVEAYEQAYQKLRDVLGGIKDSILDYDAVSGPYVSRLVLRGVSLFDTLDRIIGNEDDLVMVTKIHLLLRFIDLVQVVDTEFDQDCMPLVMDPNNANKTTASKDFRRLQKGFIQLVQSQLYFLNSTFDKTTGRWSKSDPVGEPEVYLVAIQIMSYYSARDISNNLFAYENSTAVDMLESLREELLAAGNGNQGLGDIKSAYYYVLGTVDKVISTIK